MTDPFAYLPGEHAGPGKLNGVVWAAGRERGCETIPTGRQDDKSGRWYPRGNIARGATCCCGVEHCALSSLICAPSFDIHFCCSTASSDRFRIFLMENGFPFAENEEMLGVEPLVAIMVLVQGVMLPSWACTMAPALGRQALEFTIINLVIHNQIENIRLREKLINTDTSCTGPKHFSVSPLKNRVQDTGLKAAKREASRNFEHFLTCGVFHSLVFLAWWKNNRIKFPLPVALISFISEMERTQNKSQCTYHW